MCKIGVLHTVRKEPAFPLRKTVGFPKTCGNFSVNPRPTTPKARNVSDEQIHVTPFFYPHSLIPFYYQFTRAILYPAACWKKYSFTKEDFESHGRQEEVYAGRRACGGRANVPGGSVFRREQFWLHGLIKELERPVEMYGQYLELFLASVDDESYSSRSENAFKTALEFDATTL